jgi:putative ABC transport system permease protein
MLYFLELFRIAARSITQRLVPSILTIMSMGLGVCLVVMVLTIVGVVERSFRNNSSLGYNMIVGAKGGQEQLTLNSIYYLSKPVENISYDYFLEFQSKERRDRELANSFRAHAQTLRGQTLVLASSDHTIDAALADAIDAVDRITTVDDGRSGRYGQFCEFAIPLCMGDYVSHFRAVGTTPEFFEKLEVGERGFVFAKGRAFVDDSPEYGFFEAVIGSQVASELSMGLGTKINPLHGSPDGHSHQQPFTVVGVLEPTGTPNDRAVFVNMEGFYLMEDHAKPIEEEKPPTESEPTIGAADAKTSDAKPEKPKTSPEAEPVAALSPKRERLPLEEREVTAALVRNRSVLYAPGMMNGINEGKEAQAVAPVQVIFNLFDLFVSPIKKVLLLLAVAICVVSGISILVSIYNSMNERRHEIAVMRALGAGRGAVMTIILLEAIMLSLAGGVVGWFAGHAGAVVASPAVERSTGVRLRFLDGDPSIAELAQSISPSLTAGDQSGAAKFFWSLRAEVVLIPLLIGIAIIVGVWPAISAYQTDVAKSLGK